MDFNNYNNGFGYGQYNNQYTYGTNSYPTYQGYQPLSKLQIQNPPPAPTNNLMNNLMFMNEAEVKAYIVAPNSLIYAIDKEQMNLYIKSTDGMGNSSIDKWKLSKVDNNSNQTQNTLNQANLKDFARIDDLNNYVTNEQLLKELSNFKNELKNEFNKKTKGDKE